MPSIARFDEWQNAAGVKYGTVLQVTQSTTQSGTSFSGSTVNTWYTTLTGTITPRFSTSNILIICREHAAADIDNDGQSISYLQTRILRNGSQIRISSANCDVRGGNARILDAGWKYMDSPATTSALTYQIQWQNTIANASNRSTYINYDGMASIVLMEIAA